MILSVAFAGFVLIALGVWGLVRPQPRRVASPTNVGRAAPPKAVRRMIERTEPRIAIPAPLRADDGPISRATGLDRLIEDMLGERRDAPDDGPTVLMRPRLGRGSAPLAHAPELDDDRDVYTSASPPTRPDLPARRRSR
jgi:hypothetical protein